jgi:hypothetical protein
MGIMLKVFGAMIVLKHILGYGMKRMKRGSSRRARSTRLARSASVYTNTSSRALSIEQSDHFSSNAFSPSPPPSQPVTRSNSPASKLERLKMTPHVRGRARDKGKGKNNIPDLLVFGGSYSQQVGSNSLQSADYADSSSFSERQKDVSPPISPISSTSPTSPTFDALESLPQNDQGSSEIGGIIYQLAYPASDSIESKEKRALRRVKKNLAQLSNWQLVVSSLIPAHLQLEKTSIGFRFCDGSFGDCTCDRPIMSFRNLTLLHINKLEVINVVACPCKLLLMGFFPCSPIRPTLAVHVDVLQLFKELSFRTAPNVTAFTATLDAFLGVRGYQIGSAVSYVNIWV